MSAWQRTASAVLVTGLGMTSPALACPSCSSATGDQVRALIMETTLAPGLLAVVLPLLAFGIVAAALPRLVGPLMRRGTR
jgi:hypothetical protein